MKGFPLPPRWPVFSRQHRRSPRDSMVIQVKRMSMETAAAVAKAAVDACREGHQIGVTVVDRDGIAQAVLRDTIAPTITVPISPGQGVRGGDVQRRHLGTGRSRQHPDRTCTGCDHVGRRGADPGRRRPARRCRCQAPRWGHRPGCAQKGVEAVQTDLEMAG